MMSRQALISLGILLLAFGSGIGLGLFLGGDASPASDELEKGSRASSAGVSSGIEAQDRVEGNALLSARIRELETELAEQKKDQDDALIASSRIAFFKKYHDITFQAFDGSFQVTPAMAEILGLSKEEQEAIAKHLEQTQHAMEKLDDANTTLVKQTANGVTFEIPADPQGKALKDQLVGLLSSDIGEERAQFFMNYGDFSPYTGFSGFAADKRGIEITWAQKNGTPLYTVKNLYYSGQGVSSTETSATDTLSPEYERLLQGNSSP